MVTFPFAYVGPGAGFAFLGSFFSILLSLLAGIASLLLWPFRAMLRFFRRGRSIRARVILLGVEGLDSGRAEQLMAGLRSAGSYRRLRATASDGWASAAFWKVLAEHAVDSTVLLVPGIFPDEGFRGRRLWRTAAGELISQPRYYVKYLVRLLGPFSGMTLQEREALFFSALKHQPHGVLACVLEMPEGEQADRLVGKLLQSIDRNTTVFIICGRSAVFSNRELDANAPAMQDIAPTVLRIFGIQPPESMEGKSVIRFA